MQKKIKIGDRVSFTIPSMNEEGVVEDIDEKGVAKLRVFVTESDYVHVNRYLHYPVGELRLEGWMLVKDSTEIMKALNDVHRGDKVEFELPARKQIGEIEEIMTDGTVKVKVWSHKGPEPITESYRYEYPLLQDLNWKL